MFFLLISGTLSCFTQPIPDHLFNNSHDINSLDRWGPYSKQYAGISHIEDMQSGRMVDFTVIPGLYRRSYSIPNVLFESAYHPWKVNPDMSEITYRYDLEWKDRLYVDVTYNIIDSSRVSVTMHCVNNSDVPQNILLHSVMGLRYGEQYPTVKAVDTENALVLYGCDYESFEPGRTRHDHNLVYDGWMRGEERDSRSLTGSVLGKFGNYADDEVIYSFRSDKEIKDAVIAVRYRIGKDRTAEIRVGGIARKEIQLKGSGDYEVMRIDADNIRKGDNILSIKALKKENMKIDAIFLADRNTIDGIRFKDAPLQYRPKLDIHSNDFIARYPTQRNCYAIAWDYRYGEVKEFENSDLDVFMRKGVHRHPTRYFTGDRKGHYTTAFLRPVVLKPNTDTTIVNLIATGSKEELEAIISDYHKNGIPTRTTAKSDARYLPASKEYAFGEQLLEATLLTNVVYPVYTQKEKIRHFTPGKNWNSLYTWDLGCISLALNEIDPVKAFETIRAYTTETGAQSAFIHHGTPLPIQFFAFSELCSKLQDDKVMEWMYPRLKQYYDYMTGKNSTSTTMMKSGLIRTWDYFYSSGGWDDYPPQHELRTESHLYPHVTPVVSSAYYLRAGKILRMCAQKMGLKKDVEQYDKEIAALTEAIQKYSWDEDAGYFSYVMHDGNGNPSGFYRYKDGSNFNKGLDGVSPLVGGCCTDAQAEKLIDNIFSPERLWTDVGISTVDQSASYYDPTGYWNGCVWIPHQYFIWKALLDNNRPGLAHKVAFTALDTWKNECGESHNSFEHFIISSGRGAGWHNFSGLSSPMVNFYNSYFRLGHVATGFDIAPWDSSFNREYTSFSTSLRFDKSSAGQPKALLVCMNPDYRYEAWFNGSKVKSESPYDGLLYISVTATPKPGRLEIRAIDNGSKAAEEVISRRFGKMPDNVVMKIDRTLEVDGRDAFEYQVRNGKLYITGSNQIAACRGFYDYITNNGYGVATWSGDRLELPERLPSQKRRTVVSPFRHHLYYNVCTNGYTTPYWTWDEWEKELDWMALHGFDMPIAPIAGEAIFARVWRDMGLSQNEIDEYFTGPGHMPWMRMGNMSGLDGAPSQVWMDAQIELQHKIINRMKELDMKPVFQGFAGFVPKAMKEHYPEIHLTTTRWNGFNSYMLSPMDNLFLEIQKRYIEEWEKEFGKGKYYLIDSFNEMDIPFGKQGSKERYDLLNKYSSIIFKSLDDVNPDAVWVMQGWIFGHQRIVWDPQSIEALLSGVPDDRMLVIDLAVDFNRFVWESQKTWEYVPGLFGKQWIYSTTPNFGGRTALTGVLESYQNGHIEALEYPERGNLVGYGTSPEGIENNEIVYELIADAGWRREEKNLSESLEAYSISRYGSCPEGITEFWKEMTLSSYGSFTNDARFKWQQRPVAGRKPSMGINRHYYKAIESFLSCDIDNELYRNDAICYAALYLGAKADDLLEKINWAYVYGDTDDVEKMEKEFIWLLESADRLLESHPILRLQRWYDFAAKAGQSQQEKARFIEELRRLVTVWGGPHLSDYSARVWSGLIRDFYIPRMKQYFASKKAEETFYFKGHDEWFHSGKEISYVEQYADPLKAARETVERARNIDTSCSLKPSGAIGFITPFEHLYKRNSLTWSISSKEYLKAQKIRFRQIRGTEPVHIEKVTFRGHREDLCSYTVDRKLSEGETIEIPLENKGMGMVLPQTILVQVTVNGAHRGLNSFVSVEIAE